MTCVIMLSEYYLVRCYQSKKSLCNKINETSLLHFTARTKAGIYFENAERSGLKQGLIELIQWSWSAESQRSKSWSTIQHHMQKAHTAAVAVLDAQAGICFENAERSVLKNRLLEQMQRRWSSENPRSKSWSTI